MAVWTSPEVGDTAGRTAGLWLTVPTPAQVQSVDSSWRSGGSSLPESGLGLPGACAPQGRVRCAPPNLARSQPRQIWPRQAALSNDSQHPSQRAHQRTPACVLISAPSLSCHRTGPIFPAKPWSTGTPFCTGGQNVTSSSSCSGRVFSLLGFAWGGALRLSLLLQRGFCPAQQRAPGPIWSSA